MLYAGFWDVRWVTHEGNATIAGVDKIRRLESHTSPIQIHSSDYGVISGDRLENRIAREQHGECSELVKNQGYEYGGRSNRTAQKENSLMC